MRQFGRGEARGGAADARGTRRRRARAMCASQRHPLHLAGCLRARLRASAEQRMYTLLSQNVCDR
ncbi:hypothetical protein GCM10025870_18630 [Agromyces marinus]|uniref:Uncharacterized protein n=1 Tax=Agromyces marinus TaxID=1389020 RepID=A0ABN6YBM9_9MICO|nr:hypothetical protein GCM10025870_18630 [Agromyces marinus]